MKRSIVKTFMWTLFGVVALLFASFCILMFGLPKTGAKVFEKLNLMYLSVSANHRAYKNTDKINEMSFMFDLSVKHNRQKYVDHYGTKMIIHGDFDEFVSDTNDLYKSTNAPLLFGEENYIISNLVKAKAKTKKQTDAKQMALDYLDSSTADEHIVFAIGAALNNGITFSDSEIDTIIIKYNEIKIYFEGGHDAFYTVVIANRLFEMSTTLSKLVPTDNQFALDATEFLRYLPVP